MSLWLIGDRRSVGRLVAYAAWWYSRSTTHDDVRWRRRRSPPPASFRFSAGAGRPLSRLCSWLGGRAGGVNYIRLWRLIVASQRGRSSRERVDEHVALTVTRSAADVWCELPFARVAETHSQQHQCRRKLGCMSQLQTTNLHDIYITFVVQTGTELRCSACVTELQLQPCDLQTAAATMCHRFADVHVAIMFVVGAHQHVSLCVSVAGVTAMQASMPIVVAAPRRPAPPSEPGRAQPHFAQSV